MKEYPSVQLRVFRAFNYLGITLVAFICIAPILHIFALSLSSASEANAGSVVLWPQQFSLVAYEQIWKNQQFLISFLTSCKITFAGTLLSLVLSVSCAYPLSKMYLKGRTFFAWFFVITMLFNGGLIPWYMTIKYTGLMNTFWALIIPGMLHVFDIVLLINFFRNLPNALEEAAMIDGAGHWAILTRVYLQVSTPVLATVTLLSAVGYWNSWFEGLILLNSPTQWPLQTFLQSLVVQVTSQWMTAAQAEQMAKLSDLTLHSAEIFVAMVPILLVYPFLQRYFIHGITLGSVKE